MNLLSGNMSLSLYFYNPHKIILYLSTSIINVLRITTNFSAYFTFFTFDSFTTHVSTRVILMLDHLKCLNTISNIFQMKVDRFWSCQLFGIIGRWFSNSNEKDLSKVCLPIWNYISMWMWIAKGDILWKFRFVKFIFVNCMSGTWNDQCFRELKAKQLQWLKKFPKIFLLYLQGHVQHW